MKQRKIDTYNHDDCFHLCSILEVLSIVKIRAANQPLSEIVYDLKYNFCDVCWSHMDHCECSRHRNNADWDDYNDR